MFGSKSFELKFPSPIIIELIKNYHLHSRMAEFLLEDTAKKIILIELQLED